MKIKYILIKKIHLYASLSTAALLLMFLFTSYLMIHHNWFDHEQQSKTSYVSYDAPLDQEPDWQKMLEQYDIKGRFIEEKHNQDGNLCRTYASASGRTILTILRDKNQLEILQNTKSTADALIGIHRQRGYGHGPIQYNLYALLLDLTGVSLILFAITGVIMWLRILKNNLTAWIIFGLGFVYFAITMGLLMYW